MRFMYMFRSNTYSIKIQITYIHPSLRLFGEVLNFQLFAFSHRKMIRKLNLAKSPFPQRFDESITGCKELKIDIRIPLVIQVRYALHTTISISKSQFLVLFNFFYESLCCKVLTYLRITLKKNAPS